MARRSPIPWLLLTGALLLALLAMGARVRGIALNTLFLAASATTIALVPGVLSALVLIKTNAPLRRPMLAAFGVLLFLPLFLHAGGWLGALGVGGWLVPSSENGYSHAWLDGWTGAIWIHAMAATPWIVCIVAAALARVPAELEETALLAMPAWRVLATVTLRAAAPGIAIAAIWVAVSIAAEMTITDFFQIRTFAEEVYTTAASGGFPTDQKLIDAREQEGPTSPWTASSGLAAGVAVLALVTLAVLRTVVDSFVHHADEPVQQVWRWKCGRGRYLAAVIPLGVWLLVAGLPLAALVYKAGLGTQATDDGWQRVWQSHKFVTEIATAAHHHWREIEQTLLLGLAVATTTTFLGSLIGWHLRLARRTRWLTLAVFALAISIPGPILGVLTIRLLNHPLDSPLSFLTTAYDTTLFAAWLVQCIRFTPVASLIMAAGYASIPRGIIDAARSDGAGWWGTFWWIGVLQTLPQLLVAWLATFALSAGELAATILVMPPGPPTLTIHLFALLHYGVEDRVAAMSLVFLAVVATLATITMWLATRSRREM